MNKEIQHLSKAVNNVFGQTRELLHALSAEEYIRPCTVLFNAAIGQHVRHIIELFIELDKGYSSGTVNYEKRKRDKIIETDLHFALLQMADIENGIVKDNRPLLLEAGLDSSKDECIAVHTNYYRELAYNIEHAIHHIALIKIGAKELLVETDENFGLAPATVKYRNTCVQ